MTTHQTNGDINLDKERLKKYKNVAKHEDMRRRRTECSVELRKQKREDALMKRRNVTSDDVDSESCTEDEFSKKQGAVVASMKALAIPEIVEVLKNNPTIEQLRTAFEAVRRLLSRTENAPVEEVIKSGLVTALVQALYVEDDKVQLEASWALTNIVSGTSEQTLLVIQLGAIEPLVQLSKSNNLGVAEQACWAIANIAGESAETRDMVLKAGMLEAVGPLFDRLDGLTVEFVRTLAWLHSNLCRHKSPSVGLHVLRIIGPRLQKCLTQTDKVVRQDSCWALAYLTDGNDDQANIALDSGCLQPILALLQSSRDQEIAPALRVLGNFATGSDALTQVLVDNGVLEVVRDIMAKTKSQSILKECCWLLSNVIAGTRDQIEAVIKAKLVPLIVNALENGDNRSRVEASWALANLSQGGAARQILCLAKRDYIKAFCDVLLPTFHVDLLVNVMETIFFLFRTLEPNGKQGMSLTAACDHFEEFNGPERLEALQQHPNERVYSCSYKIIAKYFNDDEEEEEEDLNLAKDGHFEF